MKEMLCKSVQWTLGDAVQSCMNIGYRFPPRCPKICQEVYRGSMLGDHAQSQLYELHLRSPRKHHASILDDHR